MKLLWLILILIGCGKAGQNGSQVTATPSATSDEADSQLFIGARLVDAASDMGVCDASKYRELIYVVESKEFYFCDKTSQWSMIDISGPKGEQGLNGLNGLKGDQGIAGTNGTNGTSGTNGKDGANGASGINGKDGAQGAAGRDGSTQVWTHPVSGERWFMGTFFTPTQLSSSVVALCPANSAPPTEAQFKDAVLAGLSNQFSASLNSNVITGIAAAAYFILKQIDRNLGDSWLYNFRLGNAQTGEITTYGANTNPQNIWNQAIYSICVLNE